MASFHSRGVSESLPERLDNRRARNRLNTDHARKFRDESRCQQILEAAIRAEKERALTDGTDEVIRYTGRQGNRYVILVYLCTCIPVFLSPEPLHKIRIHFRRRH